VVQEYEGGSALAASEAAGRSVRAWKGGRKKGREGERATRPERQGLTSMKQGSAGC
jgi:hypothetical protein